MKGEQINLTLHKGVISQVKYNKECNLIFACSLDNFISLWDIEGNLLGTYEGHNGAVWSVDSLGDNVVSGGGDMKVFNYDFETGRVKAYEILKSRVDFVKFFEDGKSFVLTDDSFKNTPKIQIYDVNSGLSSFLDCPKVPTSVTFFRNLGVFSDKIGNLSLFDIRSDKIIKSESVHTEKINEIKPSACGSFFISSSDDKFAKVVDFDLNVQNSFRSRDPINSSCIFRTNDKVVTAGGITATDVTLTGGNARFDVNFYDVITKDIVGYYSPHFGTINSIDIHLDSKSMITGGEDGIICITKFGNDFFEANFTDLILN